MPDTPVVNNNLGQSKYGRTYRCTTHYDPTTGRTIGAEATVVANYYQCLKDTDGKMEFANVGSSIVGGFENTMELKPIEYKEAINGPDGKAWEKKIENEHELMVKNDAWELVKISLLPKGTKVTDSTRACKKKITGKLSGHLNARGFKQVEGVHYNGTSTHTPVTNAGTIQIVLILMIMADWQCQIVEVKGMFLHGEFEDCEVIHMKVPSGFEKFYPDDVVLKLKKCIYGFKQTTMAFWHQLLLCMKSMGMMQNTADPCLYYKWGEDGLVLIVSWIDNNSIFGPKKAVEKTKKDLMERFDYEDCGDIKEYMECKIERTKNSLNFTQPVLMQSYNYKFELSKKSYKTPAPAGFVLVAGKKEEALSPAMQKKYCSGAGKAMHAMQYSKPEMYNAVQDLSCHMHKATQDHYKAMLCVLKCSLDYGDQGLVIKPNRKRDGSRSHEFVISGCSNLDYAKEPNNRRSVLGHMVYLEGAPAMFESSTERTVSLSTT